MTRFHYDSFRPPTSAAITQILTTPLKYGPCGQEEDKMPIPQEKDGVTVDPPVFDASRAILDIYKRVKKLEQQVDIHADALELQMPPSAVVEQHQSSGTYHSPLSPVVQEYAMRMEKRLQAHTEDRGDGWKECSPERLLQLLMERTGQIAYLLGQFRLGADDQRSNPDAWRVQIQKVATDVGNYGMMITQRIKDVAV